MCIRDRYTANPINVYYKSVQIPYTQDIKKYAMSVSDAHAACLLYTSDAADERSSVDLGGRRIIKKKTYNSSSEVWHKLTTKTHLAHHDDTNKKLRT